MASRSATQLGKENTPVENIAVIDKFMAVYDTLQQKTKKALVGYMQMDILDRTPVFSKYNKHILDKKNELLTHVGGAFGPSHATTMDQC